MVSDIKSVAKVVALNGGVLTGKTRLQKTIYFMEVLGCGFGFDYEYYHYGPYCEEINNIIDASIALDLVSVELRSGSYGVASAGFLAKGNPGPDSNDSLRVEVLKKLGSYDAISLELAATAIFLERDGYSDPWGETRRRKSAKSTEARLIKAKQLVGEVGLDSLTSS